MDGPVAVGVAKHAGVLGSADYIRLSGNEAQLHRTEARLRGGKAWLHRNVGRLRLPGRVSRVSSEGWGCKLLVELIQPLVDLQDLICERPRHRKGCGRVAKGSRGLRVEVAQNILRSRRERRGGVTWVATSRTSRKRMREVETR